MAQKRQRKMKVYLDPNMLEHFAVQLRDHKHDSGAKVQSLIARQTKDLKRKAGRNLVYQNRLNEILRNLKLRDGKENYQMMIKAYKFFYAEAMGISHQLVYYWSKVMKPHQTEKHIGMYDVARNVLIKRFGLGNPYQVLDVHSDGGLNTPMMFVITYI